MTLEQFGVEPVHGILPSASPPAPPRLPLLTIIAAARKADTRQYGRADHSRVIAAVVGQLDREDLMTVLLSPKISSAWKRAAVARLQALGEYGARDV
jgi:hypothetical protein